MKILVTNDDGVYAPGLWAAVRGLRQVGEVHVVAPDREQSGVGASLTLHHAVRVRQVTVEPELSDEGEANYPVTAYAVEGTPGDSCVLALEQLVGKVDLVVSGINRGSNLGWDVMVSGTVGAAIQGYVRGYPTLAVSVGSVQNPHFDGAARLVQLIAHQLMEQPPQSGFLLNINVPSAPLGQITGLQVTNLGNRSYGETVREEGFGHDKRYWIARNRAILDGDQEGSDMWALRQNRISITPLHLSLCHQEMIASVESLFASIPAQLLGRQD